MPSTTIADRVTRLAQIADQTQSNISLRFMTAAKGGQPIYAGIATVIPATAAARDLNRKARLEFLDEETIASTTARSSPASGPERDDADGMDDRPGQTARR
jgi:hypothetical protein